MGIFSFLLENDVEWCEFMDYFNPYEDPFKYVLSNSVPVYDKSAYDKYPKHNFVYDKLFIAKSQGIEAGKLENIKLKNLNFPIFIKPRWGHKTSTSKNCIKINNPNELEKYKNYKNMMWSKFINENEGMTDYILQNGKIVYQLTYNYSPEQKGFTDVWKYISPANKPPPIVTEWINKYFLNYTGIVNAQYRGDIIIEISLRFARGGAYLNSTENKYLIENINNLIENNDWNYSISDQMKFEPFWGFKCFTKIPILYLFSQHSLNKIMKHFGVMPFYEYYFEPTGKEGMVFLQFLHKDFNKGMEIKNKMEKLFNNTQLIFYFLLLLSITLIYIDKKIGFSVLVILIVLLLTRFLNPMTTLNNLYKAQKQYFLNESSTENLQKYTKW